MSRLLSAASEKIGGLLDSAGEAMGEAMDAVKDKIVGSSDRSKLVSVLECSDHYEISRVQKANGGVTLHGDTVFGCDAFFPADSKNDTIFKSSLEGHVKKFLGGKDCVVVLFGASERSRFFGRSQGGHQEANKGDCLMQMITRLVFDKAKDPTSQISLSMAQVINNGVCDILNPTGNPSESNPTSVNRMVDSRLAQTVPYYIRGLAEIVITSKEEMDDMIAVGMNATRIREKRFDHWGCHTVLEIKITRQDQKQDGFSVFRVLNLAPHSAQAQHQNKGLSAFSDCVDCLAEEKKVNVGASETTKMAALALTNGALLSVLAFVSPRHDTNGKGVLQQCAKLAAATWESESITERIPTDRAIAILREGVSALRLELLEANALTTPQSALILGHMSAMNNDLDWYKLQTIKARQSASEVIMNRRAYTLSRSGLAWSTLIPLSLNKQVVPGDILSVVRDTQELQAKQQTIANQILEEISKQRAVDRLNNKGDANLKTLQKKYKATKKALNKVRESTRDLLKDMASPADKRENFMLTSQQKRGKMGKYSVQPVTPTIQGIVEQRKNIAELTWKRNQLLMGLVKQQGAHTVLKRRWQRSMLQVFQEYQDFYEEEHNDLERRLHKLAAPSIRTALQTHRQLEYGRSKAGLY